MILIGRCFNVNVIKIKMDAGLLVSIVLMPAFRLCIWLILLGLLQNIMTNITSQMYPS